MRTSWSVGWCLRVLMLSHLIVSVELLQVANTIDLHQKIQAILRASTEREVPPETHEDALLQGETGEIDDSIESQDPVGAESSDGSSDTAYFSATSGTPDDKPRTVVEQRAREQSVPIVPRTNKEADIWLESKLHEIEKTKEATHELQAAIRAILENNGGYGLEDEERQHMTKIGRDGIKIVNDATSGSEDSGSDNFASVLEKLLKMVAEREGPSEDSEDAHVCGCDTGDDSCSTEGCGAGGLVTCAEKEFIRKKIALMVKCDAELAASKADTGDERDQSVDDSDESVELGVKGGDKMDEGVKGGSSNVDEGVKGAVGEFLQEGATLGTSVALRARSRTGIWFFSSLWEHTSGFLAGAPMSQHVHCPVTSWVSNNLERVVYLWQRLTGGSGTPGRAALTGRIVGDIANYPCPLERSGWTFLASIRHAGVLETLGLNLGRSSLIGLQAFLGSLIVLELVLAISKFNATALGIMGKKLQTCQMCKAEIEKFNAGKKQKRGFKSTVAQKSGESIVKYADYVKGISLTKTAKTLAVIGAVRFGLYVTNFLLGFII